ncbi:M20 metallopeptidase family protein [Clostridium cochlearium]|uniref:M20 metallopeptidase family protein n=1 Tax=Clostridium cochlearium TaxID=1494 RepID=UPI000BBB85A8|nr:amidohydrolase [Clostridium cochlearium]
MNVKRLLDNVEEYIIKQRRYFHENPELSWEEFNTSKRIREELDSMNIPYDVVKETGVIGTIRGSKPGKKLGIRADIDALPVQEETDLLYASKKNGVMHACGHDAHTAILLGTAKILNEMRDEISGEVRLIFQPAEECIQDSGAKYLSQVDSIKNLDRIIGMHVWGALESGKGALREGPIMASADTFDIFIEGKSGHGAAPNTTVDPIVAGSMVVQALQTIVSRENDPLEPQVISVTAFNSGNSKNVIPGSAHLEGTVRTFNNELREHIKWQMKRVLSGVAEISRTKINLDYHEGTPSTINEEMATQLGIKIAQEVFQESFVEDFPLQMGGEDFAKYLTRIPGCLLFLGAAGPAGKFNQHNEKFQIDESVLILGVEYFTRYTLEYLK